MFFFMQPHILFEQFPLQLQPRPVTLLFFVAPFLNCAVRRFDTPDEGVIATSGLLGVAGLKAELSVMCFRK